MDYSPLFNSFFIIRELFAVRQEGNDGDLFEMTKPRPTDAFLLLTDSTALYHQSQKEPLYVPHGALVYIPRGCTYVVENNCPNQTNRVGAILFEFELHKIDIAKGSETIQNNLQSEDNYISLGTDEVTIVDFRPKLYERLFSSLADTYNDWKNKRASEIAVHRAAYAIFDFLVKNKYLSSAQEDTGIVDVAMNYLANTGENEKSIYEIASLCCISVSCLEKTFHKATGMSPMEYRMECRITKAKNMLAEKKASIAEISARLGFCDNSYFCRTFKKYVGVTPSNFRSMSN